MFVPVILDFENYGPKFVLLKYLRFLDVCVENEWPIITHEEFEDYETNFAGRAELTEKMTSKYNYKLYTAEERAHISQFFVPKNFYEKLEEEKGSKLEMMIALLNERNEEFEEIITKILNDIIEQCGDIEGILYFAACPYSLKYVCEKMNLPMVAYETGPIRKENYRCDLSYFCRKGVYRTDEIAERYNSFCKEIETTPEFYHELSREEIICMFINNKHLKFLSEIDKEPRYEIGVAGSCAMVVPFFAQNKYMDNEMINDVFREYMYGQVLIRFHPFDIYTATYRISKVDKSDTIFPFLLKSRRIAAVASNTLLEAMLWKRIPCSKTKCMPANLMCYNNYLADEEREDVVRFVNFFIFNFMVPMELAYDIEYLRWRMTDPTEREIYEYHMEYYINQFGINRRWLHLEPEARFEMLKAFRNYKPITPADYAKSFVFGKYGETEQTQASVGVTSSLEYKKLQQLNKKLENENMNLKRERDDAKVWLNDVLNSKSWKMTHLPRVILDKLKGVKK